MGKGKRVDVYLEVRKRRGIYFLNETRACVINRLMHAFFHIRIVVIPLADIGLSG